MIKLIIKKELNLEAGSNFEAVFMVYRIFFIAYLSLNQL